MMNYWYKRTAALGLVVVLSLGVMAFTDGGDKRFEITKQMDLFAKVYKELNANYVDELDPGELMKIGIDAMMNALDPYTKYYSENQIERYKFKAQGSYDGLGARVAKVGEDYTIIEPYQGYAADEAGLKAGDKIRAIDGTAVEGKPEVEVQAMIKGAMGTDVVLDIQPYGQDKTKSVTLSRAAVDRPNVPYSGMVDEEVGYIVLTTFTPQAAANITKALNELKADHPQMKYVILDLRGNGGGLLREAIAICNIFIDQGQEVVSTKGKVRERDKSYATRSAPVDTNIPLAVLINGRSASASEIVSGVMQDLDRGVIIGQRSYGKGLVQNTKSLGYNSNMKLTTSKYYIPSGRCIQSVAYADGEPIDIPDSERAIFYTKAGRPVLDGGGVRPDVELAAPVDPEVLQSLRKEHVIFSFVNEYLQEVDTISAPESYRFQDYDRFKNYVNTSGFSYKHPIEAELKKLKEEDSDVQEEVAKAMDALMQKIDSSKDSDLDNYQDVISREIEQEIVTRFYYEKGKIKQRLDADPELDEAIAILKDAKRYNKLLSK